MARPWSSSFSTRPASAWLSPASLTLRSRPCSLFFRVPPSSSLMSVKVSRRSRRLAMARPWLSNSSTTSWTPFAELKLLNFSSKLAMVRACFSNISCRSTLLSRVPIALILSSRLFNLARRVPPSASMISAMVNCCSFMFVRVRS